MTTITYTNTSDNPFIKKTEFNSNLNTVKLKYTQQRTNTYLNNIEKDLDIQIHEYFKNLNINYKMFIYHHSPLLSKKLKCPSYKEKKGFTLLVFEIENKLKTFSFSLCSLKDNFSKLDGRVFAKIKAIDILKAKGIDGLYTYPINSKMEEVFKDKSIEDINKSITPSKIGNWIINNFITKKVKEESFDINVDEDILLNIVKDKIKTLFPQVLSITPLIIQVRQYETDLFSSGLFATKDWLNSQEIPGKCLKSTGGYTVYNFRVKTEVEEFTLFTFSTCNIEDNFNTKLGRKVCLLNFVKNNFNTYTLSKQSETFEEDLLRLLETCIKKPINFNFNSYLSN